MWREGHFQWLNTDLLKGPSCVHVLSYGSALDRLYNATLSISTLEDELQWLANLSCLTVGGAEVLGGVQRQLKAFDLAPHSDNDDGNDADDDDDDEGESDVLKSHLVGRELPLEETMWDFDDEAPLTSRPVPIKELRYFILDCRPHEDFVRYQLATSMHLDPKLLDNVAEGEMIVEQLKAMTGSHFCLLGSNGNGALKDHDHDPVSRFVKLFLKHGFCHISVVLGGMPACERLISEGHKHRRVKSNSLGGLMVMSRGSMDEEAHDKKSSMLKRWFSSRNNSSSSTTSKSVDTGGGRGSSRPSSPSPDRPRRSRPGSFNSSISKESKSQHKHPRRSTKGSKKNRLDRRSSDLR